MKSITTRGILAFAMAAALGIGTPAVAFGGTTTTSTTNAPATTTTVQTFKVGAGTPWKQWRHAEEA